MTTKMMLIRPTMKSFSSFAKTSLRCQHWSWRLQCSCSQMWASRRRAILRYSSWQPVPVSYFSSAVRQHPQEPIRAAHQLHRNQTAEEQIQYRLLICCRCHESLSFTHRCEETFIICVPYACHVAVFTLEHVFRFVPIRSDYDYWPNYVDGPLVSVLQHQMMCGKTTGSFIYSLK